MGGVSERVKRMFLILFGTISLGIGCIGIIIPVLPTAPFLLLATACYLRGSERLHHWMINNSVFGGFIKNYMEGRGIKPRQKFITLAFLWMSITFSALFLTENFIISIMLFLIAIGVSVHILTLPSLRLR